MVILEFLDMRSILRYIIKNRIAILGIIDIAIVFWIVWFERQIQYEPLLDYSSNLSVMKLPLHPEVYNTMIVTIILNIVEHKHLIGRNLNRNGIFINTADCQSFDPGLIGYIGKLIFAADMFFYIIPVLSDDLFIHEK